MLVNGEPGASATGGDSASRERSIVLRYFAALTLNLADQRELRSTQAEIHPASDPFSSGR